MADSLPLRRAFVTGATGFTGSRLLPSLVSSGVDVVACSRSPHHSSTARWVRLTLPDPPPPDSLDGVDVVFHLAAYAHSVAVSRNDARLYEEVNVSGTAAVAQAAASAGVRRLVLMSSVKAMRRPGDGMVTEDDPGMPDDPYGLSKRQAEAAAFAAAEGAAMDIVVIRPALVYGPGVKGNLATLLDALSKGKRPPIPDVPNRRSLVGLVDVVRAAQLCAVRPEAANRTYVLTDGEAYSTRRIIDALAAGGGVDGAPRFTLPLGVLRVASKVGDLGHKVTGKRFPFDSGVLERLIGNAEYESQRIQSDMGFQASVALENVASDMATAHFERSADIEPPVV